MAGLTANYQFKHHLFTARMNHIAQDNAKIPSWLVPVPANKIRQYDNERIALMYGYRMINEETSVSLSLGISYSDTYYYNKKTETELSRFDYLGVPFELNLKGFKGFMGSNFGHSLGLKLNGNLSKKTFFGVALSYGFGFHK